MSDSAMADRSMVDTARVTAPDVSYTRSGDVSIAYQVVGTGPVDIVFVRGITGDLLSTWDQPLLVRHVEGLAAIGRVLMLDKRGTGLSDRVRRGAGPRVLYGPHPCRDGCRRVRARSPLERRDEYRARHALRGHISRSLCRSRPVRSEGFGTRSDDYPWAPTQSHRRRTLAEVRAGWGDRTYLERLASDWAPEVADDPVFCDWFVWHMRRSLSPGLP